MNEKNIVTLKLGGIKIPANGVRVEVKSSFRGAIGTTILKTRDENNLYISECARIYRVFLG